MAFYSRLFPLMVVVALLAVAVQSKLVKFDAELTWEVRSPDGHPREMILINGQSPGPALELDEGDSVEFLVKNSMHNKSATIHFHGITQLGTPWSDGTPGVSQRTIRSGHSFLYRWTADTYGTYFYHGHLRGDIADGLYGPILIHPKPNTPTPFHLITNSSSSLSSIRKAVASPQLVTISDWSRWTFQKVLESEKESNLDLICLDSILVNGKGAVHCPGVKKLTELESPPVKALLNGSHVTDQGCLPFLPLAQGAFKHHNRSAVLPGLESGCDPARGYEEIIKVDPTQNEWVSMNFISTTVVQAPIVSIDEHPMWVYEVDGRYVEPTKVDGLAIFNGERYSVLVKLDKKPGDYTIRVPNSGINQIISGFAKLRYTNAHSTKAKSKPYFNYGAASVSADVTVLNTTLLVPFPNDKPAQEADALHVLNITRKGGSYLWTLSGDERYAESHARKEPLLFRPNSTEGFNKDLVIRTHNNTWVDIVLQMVPNSEAPAQPSHPIHKHSNKAYIIGAGSGHFKWTSVKDAMKEEPQFFNLDTPLPRDIFLTPPLLGTEPVWLVIRYQSMNPGAWFLHCHIQTHFSGGMAVAILDGVDAFPKIPSEYRYGNGGA